MNWKYEAIDKLKQYAARKSAVQSIPEEIRRLEMSISGIRSSTSDGTPVKGGGSGKEDIYLSNIVRRQELERSLENAKSWVAFVQRGLDFLAEDERLILDRFYIYPAKGNVERLCMELSCEQATVYRRRDAALRKFTICLYGCTEI